MFAVGGGASHGYPDASPTHPPSPICISPYAWLEGFNALYSEQTKISRTQRRVRVGCSVYPDHEYMVGIE